MNVRTNINSFNIADDNKYRFNNESELMITRAFNTAKFHASKNLTYMEVISKLKQVGLLPSDY